MMLVILLKLIKYILTKQKNELKTPFCPENEKKITDDFAPYMNENKLITCTPNKKIVCDWSDKNEYLIHYKMLNFYSRPWKNKRNVRNRLKIKFIKKDDNEKNIIQQSKLSCTGMRKSYTNFI